MRVGAYRLLQRLGCGASSEVWKASQVPTGEIAALKFTDRGRPHPLDHPNIVRVLSVHPEYQVLEYVPGGTLREKLDKEGRLPFEQAWPIAKAIASGLAHAHERGIAHLDLKPESILLGPPVKIADFSERPTGSMTSDIYSFGVILEEMLGMSVPDEVEPILDRCLRLRPEQRYLHAMDLLKAIRRADPEIVAPAARPSRLAGIKWLALGLGLGFIPGAAEFLALAGRRKAALVLGLLPGIAAHLIALVIA
jgi:serine/threonine protein kinase